MKTLSHLTPTAHQYIPKKFNRHEHGLLLYSALKRDQQGLEIPTSDLKMFKTLLNNYYHTNRTYKHPVGIADDLFAFVSWMDGYLEAHYSMGSKYLSFNPVFNDECKKECANCEQAEGKCAMSACSRRMGCEFPTASNNAIVPKLLVFTPSLSGSLPVKFNKSLQLHNHKKYDLAAMLVEGDNEYSTVLFKDNSDEVIISFGNNTIRVTRTVYERYYAGRWTGHHLLVIYKDSTIGAIPKQERHPYDHLVLQAMGLTEHLRHIIAVLARILPKPDSVQNSITRILHALSSGESVDIGDLYTVHYEVSDERHLGSTLYTLLHMIAECDPKAISGIHTCLISPLSTVPDGEDPVDLSNLIANTIPFVKTCLGNDATNQQESADRTLIVNLSLCSQVFLNGFNGYRKVAIPVDNLTAGGHLYQHLIALVICGEKGICTALLRTINNLWVHITPFGANVIKDMHEYLSGSKGVPLWLFYGK